MGLGPRGEGQGQSRPRLDLASTPLHARVQACAALFNLARCGTLTRELEARPRDFGEAVQGLVAVLKAHPRRKVLQHCGRQVVLQLAELARGDGTSNTAQLAIAMDAALHAAGVPPAWREAEDEGASPRDAPD